MDPWPVVEIVAVAFGVAYVVLAIRENPLCWPAGIVNVLLYAALFAHARLYGAAGLQVVYLAFSAYGWHQWLRGGEGSGRLRVTRTPASWAAGLLAATMVASVGFAFLFRTYTDDALPLLDGATTAVSLAAQWMTTRKWLENWLVWIAVDAVYVGMYLHQGLHGTAALYLLFLVMAAVGWREWRASAARPPMAAAGAPA